MEYYRNVRYEIFLKYPFKKYIFFVCMGPFISVEKHLFTCTIQFDKYGSHSYKHKSCKNLVRQFSDNLPQWLKLKPSHLTSTIWISLVVFLSQHAISFQLTHLINFIKITKFKNPNEQKVIPVHKVLLQSLYQHYYFFYPNIIVKILMLKIIKKQD